MCLVPWPKTRSTVRFPMAFDVCQAPVRRLRLPSAAEDTIERGVLTNAVSCYAWERICKGPWRRSCVVACSNTA